MNRHWTPESRVTITDTGMVIEIEIGNLPVASLAMSMEEGVLSVRGQHPDFGPFECKFQIPPDHQVVDDPLTIVNGVLRLELEKGKPESEPFGLKFPRPMLIYCKQCGKHFDIVLTGTEPAEYRCPGCGAVQTFSLDSLIKGAIGQSLKMRRRPPGRG